MLPSRSVDNRRPAIRPCWTDLASNHYDTVSAAASQSGTDLVVLFAVAPLPAWSLWRCRHGAASEVLMWARALPILLSIYAGPALGTMASTT